MSVQGENSRVPEQLSGPNGTVTVGDATISIQHLQQIYKELTGKSESVSKYYDLPIHLTFTDLENLHYKIIQSLAQYNVTQSSENFTIYYSENKKEEFSSFDRLKLHNAGASESVESILCKYNLLIIPPSVGKPQTYQISIRVTSQLSVFRTIRGGDVSRIIRIMGQRVISAEVNYIDYAIARTLLNIVDDWVKTIPQESEKRIIKKLQTYSHWIPRILRLFSVFIIGYAITDAITYSLKVGENDVRILSYLFLYASIFSYIIYHGMSWLGMFAEQSIDTWMEMSYIKLNRADEVAISKN